MMRLGPGSVLVVATHNPGKLREISELLAPYGIGTKGAGALGLPEPEETGADFAANARLKAEAAAHAAGLPALADDSGLCVDSLGGAPGIHSARWAGPGKDFAAAMARIARELETRGAGGRGARFVCALALAWPGGPVRVYEGEVRGTLVFPPRGRRGFGYDPIFVAEGHGETFAEMEPARKHAISHRARAFAKFVAGELVPGTEQ